MNKYEQLIEHIINDDDAKARALFHDIVVEKSRDIYESLMDEEYAEEDIHSGNQVDRMMDEIQGDETMEGDDEMGMGGDDMGMGGDGPVYGGRREPGARRPEKETKGSTCTAKQLSARGTACFAVMMYLGVN